MRSRGGWAMIEMLTSVTIIILVAALLADALHTSAQISDLQLKRQHCIAAAQAQLDSIERRGTPLDDTDAKRIWPDVRVQLEQQPGAGQWQGLTLWKAAAQADMSWYQASRSPVRVALSRYVAPRIASAPATAPAAEQGGGP